MSTFLQAFDPAHTQKMVQVSIQVTKERMDIPVGVELTALPGTSELIVRRIATTGGSGPFGSSTKNTSSSSKKFSQKLQPGMQLLGVNGTPLTGRTPAQATALLQAAPPGPLCLECGGIPVTAIKDTATTRIGLTLTLHPLLGFVRIQKVEVDSLFHGVLHVGQRITAIQTPSTARITHSPWLINPTDAEYVIDVLQEAVGQIYIAAIDVEGLVTTIVEKPQPDSKVGVTLRLHEDIESECVHNEHNYIFVRKVTPGGLLDKATATGTTTIVGSYSIKYHRVVTINGHPCPETIAEANDLIQTALTTVILETIPVDWGFTAEQLEKEPSIPILQTGQILATIIKESPTDKIGLKLTRVFNSRRGGSRLVISHIEKELKFGLLGLNHRPGNNTLQLGMHLVSINSQPCHSTMTASQAAELFQRAVGTVHIVASPIVAQAKAHKKAASKLGLGLGKTKVGIVVANIHDDDGGLLVASSDLQVGQQIVSINDQKCPHQLNEAVQLLREQSRQDLTVVALDVVPEMIPEWPEDCRVTATAYKPTIDSVVGVGLNKSVQGRIVISRVWEKGLFARSALQVGLVLLTINGVTCPSTHMAAVQLIKEAKGELALVCAKSVEVARKPHISHASKAPVKIGISLGNTSKGIVIVDLDATNGLFQWGILKRNQRVIKINGEPCPERVQDAVALLKEVPSGNAISVEAVDTLPQKYEWPEDCLVTVTATKTRVHEYVGLRVTPSHTHRIVLSHIDSSGLFGKFAKKLIPGMVVVSIDGRDCPDNCDETIDLLQSFPDGRPLTIVAAKTVSHLYRSGDEKWGLSLAKTTKGSITVHKIDPNGAVAKAPRALLKVNQRVVDISGKLCPTSVEESAALLREAKDQVVITTVDSFAKLWSTEEELVVSVSKQSATTRVGIGLMKSTQGRIAVSSVDKDSMFADWGIQLGYVVVSINSKACPLNAKEAIATIQQTIGDLTIVFAKTVASVEKTDPGAMLGIKLGRTRKHGVIVHEIGPDSVFATTNLMERQKILSINGTPCPQKLDEAVALIHAANEKVAIEAVDAVYPIWSPECLVTASVFKATRQKFVGLDFALSLQGRLAIARVDDKGLFANKGIFEGHVLVAINGKAIDSTIEARQIVHDCVGELTVVVAHSADQAYKENMDTAVGLSLGLDASEGIIIEEIEPGGLFASSRLFEGQKIVSINNIPCPSTVPDTVAILKQADGSLQIVARDALDAPVWSKEGLATAIVKKENKRSAVGIEFCVSTQGRVVVATIDEDGPLAKSGLQSGQILVSINEERVPGSPVEASKTIREREVEVSIVAMSPVATAIKQSKNDIVGLSIGRSVKGLVIRKIDPVGLFAASCLQKDQLILSINGQPCPEKVIDAVRRLKEAEGLVKLAVVDSLPDKFEWPRSCRKVVKALKEYHGQFVGLEVEKSDQGRMAVARVDENGIFAGKSIHQGMVILQINNAECPATTEETIQLMNQSPLEVKLVVATSIVSTKKLSMDSKVGLTIGTSKKHGMIVREIDETSLFRQSPLSEGQQILSINGRCPSNVDEAMSLIQTSEGELSIEAVDTVSTGRSSESLFTAVARKTADRKYYGIGILRSLQGRVCIGRVDEAGLFAGSGLLPGHIIVSINGIEVPENIKKTVDILGNQENGDIGIVVATTIAKVQKDPAISTLGLSLWKNKAEGVVVHSIDQTGLFQETPLAKEQKLVSINGEPCPSEVKATIHMLGQATVELKIVALDGVRPEWPRECIMTSKSRKSTIDDYVGVETIQIKRKRSSRLIISRIDELGIFAKSPGLMVGQTLVSINGTHFPSSPEEMFSNLREAGVGELVLVTARTVVAVEKSTKETELGISLGTLNTAPSSIESDSSRLLVSRISKNSPFETTLLQEGQRIVRINGESCPKSPEDAISVIKAAVGTLSIEAVDFLLSSPGEVTVSVRKRSMQTKLGLSMRKSLQGRIVISNVEKGGKLASSELRTGQHVLSINQRPCPDSTKEAVDMIANAKGVVTIVATSSIARVPKISSTTKFGLSFAKNSNGVVVYRLESSGLFGSTSLRIGQKVIAINGQSCPSEVADAVRIIQEAKDHVEIEAVDVLYHWSEDDKKNMKRPEMGQEQAKCH